MATNRLIIDPYSIQDCTAFIGSQEIPGITGFSVDNSAAQEYIRGKGREPYGISTGDISISGSLSINFEDFAEFLSAVGSEPVDTLLAVYFTIQYNMDKSHLPLIEADTVFFNQTLTYCKFTSLPQGWTRDNINQTTELPFMSCCHTFSAKTPRVVVNTDGSIVVADAPPPEEEEGT